MKKKMNLILLISILKIIYGQNDALSYKYKTNKNYNFTSNFTQLYSITSLKTLNKHQCLTECNKIDQCLVSIFDQNLQSSKNCILTRKSTITDTDLVVSQNSSVYFKKCKFLSQKKIQNYFLKFFSSKVHLTDTI